MLGSSRCNRKKNREIITQNEKKLGIRIKNKKIVKLLPGKGMLVDGGGGGGGGRFNFLFISSALQKNV